jgi:hypothetical protein
MWKILFGEGAGVARLKDSASGVWDGKKFTHRIGTPQQELRL